MYPVTNDSARPISRPPSIAPGIEPMPPTTAAVNALSPAMNPMVFVTWLNSRPAMMPATPASAEPRKNVDAMMKFTLIPSISAASRSAATARICLPSFVRLTSNCRPVISARPSTRTMICTLSMVTDPMRMPLDSEMNSAVL